MTRASAGDAVLETTGRLEEARDLSDRFGRRELVCPTCGYMIVLDREPQPLPDVRRRGVGLRRLEAVQRAVTSDPDLSPCAG